MHTDTVIGQCLKCGQPLTSGHKCSELYAMLSKKNKPAKDEIIFGGYAGAGKSNFKWRLHSIAHFARQFVPPEKLAEFDAEVQRIFDELEKAETEYNDPKEYEALMVGKFPIVDEED